MEKKLIQCYRVSEGEFYVIQATKRDMERFKFYESPIDAIAEAIEGHQHSLSNELFTVKKRQDKIDKLQKVLDDYKNGNGDILKKDKTEIYKL